MFYFNEREIINTYHIKIVGREGNRKQTLLKAVKRTIHEWGFVRKCGLKENIMYLGIHKFVQKNDHITFV